MLKITTKNLPFSQEEKKRLFICMLVSALWTLVAHGYVFFQDSFSHDSLNAVFADSIENRWKMSLGRILKPLYQILFRGDFALPWLIGVLSILWLGLAVWLIVQIFDVRSLPAIAVISGILCTNLTLSATAATYIYDLDANTLALLLAVSAAWAWRKGGMQSLWAIPCLCGSLCIYQTFVTAAILCIMLACMFDLSRGRSFDQVFKKGLIGIMLLILGALAYLIALWLCSLLTGITYDTQTYNSLNTVSALTLPLILQRLKTAYLSWWDQLLKASAYAYGADAASLMHLVLAVCLPICVLPRLLGKGCRVLPFLLFLLLAFLLPVAIYLPALFSGVVHCLVFFSLWLVYLGALVLVLPFPGKPEKRLGRISRIAVFAVLAVILWGNVRTANSIYLQKDLEQDATLSLMTRVVYRMETHDDYIPEQTPVAFIGATQMTSGSGFKTFDGITGVSSAGSYFPVDRTPLCFYNAYEKYFHYVLGQPVRSCDDDVWLQLKSDPRVAQMPCYPAEGCMGLIDGVFVIKMN